MINSGDNSSCRARSLILIPFTGDACKSCNKRAHNMWGSISSFYQVDPHYYCSTECIPTNTEKVDDEQTS